MAAEMKVTDAAVEAALSVLFTGNSTYVIPNYREPMRAALEAGLAAMLEPVGWKYAGLFPNVPKFREDRADGYTKRIYTIKEPK